MQAFALSSNEGVALMCLAEALLRIPDADTADALIRDKIGGGDWRSQAGLSESLFVNAACWGLVRHRQARRRPARCRRARARAHGVARRASASR